MRTIVLVLAIFAAGVATVLGFQWFGTDGEHWTGWISASLLLYLVSLVVDDVPMRRRTTAA